MERYNRPKMTFSRDDLPERPGTWLSEDRFRQTEIATTFKRIRCQRCGLAAIYKYRVKQIRRKAEIETSEEQEIRDDHLLLWNSIPRFAEIPETIRCKQCSEILPQETLCIY